MATDPSLSVRARRGNRRVNSVRPRTRSRLMSETGSFRIQKGPAASLGLMIVGLIGIAFAGGYGLGRRTERLVAQDRILEAHRLAELGSAIQPSAEEEVSEPRPDEFSFFETLAAKAETPVPPRAPKETPVREAEAEAASSPTPVAITGQASAKESAGIAEDEESKLEGALARLSSKIRERSSQPAPGADEEDLKRGLTTAPAPAGHYTIQVSAFKSAPDAQAHVERLKKEGLSAFLVQGASEGVAWYRVRVGSFSDPEEAQAAKRLLAQRNIDGWVLEQL